MPNLSRACKGCEKQFDTKYAKKVFCNNKCRIEYWMKNNPRVLQLKTWEKIGEIIIDSGACWIGDVGFKSEDLKDLGIEVFTGYGDGTYPVLVRREGQFIKEVRVTFISDKVEL